MDTHSKRGKRSDLLDTLTVERAQYVELRSTKSTALLGNRLSDGDSLYLFITPNNAKSWRMDYRFPKGGRKRVIVFGSYPAMGLGQARKGKLAAKLVLAEGRDPAAEKGKALAALREAEEQKQGEKKNTFRKIAAEWLEAELKAKPRSAVWKSNTERWLSWASDEFGNKPLPEIKAADILALIKRVAQKTPASAEFCRQVIARVFDYAIVTLRQPDGMNPAHSLRRAIIVPPRKHRPMLDAKELPQFLSDLDKYDGPESVKLGVKILLHAFPRKNELAEAPWKEIDLDAAEWRISAERMKTKQAHTVPLSRQVVAMFRRLKELAGDSPFVFPSRHRNKTEPMTGQVFNYCLNSIGYRDRLSPHGTRATAASVLADAGHDVHVIDAALAHVQKSQTTRAYFRNDYREQRRALSQAWSDLLDSFAAGGNVIPINAAKAAA